jgi:sigma-B regulation protein RsbU (phosphoserine phosphatase)
VRDPLPVRVEGVPLAAGDTLFFYSDGVVEARRDGSDELYGFERLEESLRRHAAGGPRALRDGLLADLDRFTGGAPREDDQTIVVLRVP